MIPYVTEELDWGGYVMKNRIISTLLLITVLFLGISVYSTSIYAADGTVKIFFRG